MSPAKTAEPIDLPFGKWSYGLKNQVLDGGPDPQGKEKFWVADILGHVGHACGRHIQNCSHLDVTIYHYQWTILYCTSVQIRNTADSTNILDTTTTIQLLPLLLHVPS